MSNNTLIVRLDQEKAKSFIMPSGFENSVDVYCWGAGGGAGWGGAPGGGGGYAKTTVAIPAGSEVALQIGQPGVNAPSATGAGGLGGIDPTFRSYRGGNGGARGTWCGQTNGPFPSGGGGGASWVSVDNAVVCVGAGGGGGGGYGHDQVKNPGKPGGVYPDTTNPAIYAVSGYNNWGSFINAYGVWGAGQDYSVVINFPTSGTYTFNFSVDNYGSIALDGSDVITRTGEYNYSSTYTATASVSAGNHTVRVRGFNISGPAGVAAQILKPDSSELWNTRQLLVRSGLNTISAGQDAAYGGGGGGGYLGGASGGQDWHNVTGGNGGLNYGDVTAPGSGALGGGRTVSFYPGNGVGEAGNEGHIVLVLTPKLTLQTKVSGAWADISASYVKMPTQTINLQQSLPGETVTYNSVSTTTWTVPAGVVSITVTAIGGGGGGGGSDSNQGAVGRSGARISGTLAVSPGEVLTISVGSGGAGGSGEAGSAPGGKGGVNSLGYNGGSGGNSGPNGVSGAGGGGGAASVVIRNNTPLVVAAGGGGGGGGGNNGAGGDVNPGGLSGIVAGGSAANKSGDGGGPGGGGGGYPLGGAAGVAGSGDVGGFSGADGQSLVPAGFTTASANNGGTNAVRGSRGATGGGGGSITISYQPAPITVTTTSGGWRQVKQIYTKVSGSWRPLFNNRNITLRDLTPRRITANITISANTNDYDLLSSLPMDYEPGLMDITVWVLPNVVIRGENTQSAFLVNQFASGDKIKIINYGTIQGKGGSGGSAGVYIAPDKFSSGVNAPGGAGTAGGGGLVTTSRITLENQGTIAGGGGGGGGGGVGVDSNWKNTTYTQGGRGGGGAGFGSGYNNGTLTAGGAGQNVGNPAGDGGTGGGRGLVGAAGGAGTYNKGGPGGAAGPAIAATIPVTITTAGTVIGPTWASVNGLI